MPSDKEFTLQGRKVTWEAMENLKWANDCGGKTKKSLPKLLNVDKDMQKSHWEIHDTHSGTDTLKPRTYQILSGTRAN